MNLLPLRRKLFRNALRQEDASEFLRLLFQDNDTSYLNNFFTYNRSIVYQCPNENCAHETVQVEDDVMYSLIIPNQLPNEKHTMQQLVDLNLNRGYVFEEKVNCVACKVERVYSRSTINNFGPIIIFVLQLIGPDRRKNTKFKLTDVARQNLHIQNKTYEFSGAIFHVGEQFNYGHYTAILRNDKNLFMTDDTIVTACSRWPNNSSGVYILFYIEKQSGRNRKK